MAQSQQDPWVYAWSGLRCPLDPDRRRCDIRSQESGWQHFVQRHMLPRADAFVDWLGNDLTRRLAEAWSNGCPQVQRHAVIQQAGKKMASAFERCMNAPIVLTYRRVPNKSSTGKGENCWRLPLCNGCRVFVREIRQHSVLKTCYFARDVTSGLAAFWWLRELRSTILDYGDIHPETDKRDLLPNPRKRTQRSADYDTDIRFVKPRVWGFASEEPGAPWSPPMAYPEAWADGLS